MCLMNVGLFSSATETPAVKAFLGVTHTVQSHKGNQSTVKDQPYLKTSTAKVCAIFQVWLLLHNFGFVS